MKRVDISPVKYFWSIAKLYWIEGERSRAYTLSAILICLLLISTWLGVVLNTQQGVVISSLASGESSRFWRAIVRFVAVLLAYAPLMAGFNYITGRLGNYWRRWLTHRFLDRYLGNRNFYELVSHPEIDNPDQRISEDVRSFTQDSLKFLLLILGYVFQLVAFSGVLWQIYPPLFFLIVAYGSLGTILTVFIFGRPLTTLQFAQLRKEADFRFNLVQIRDNAESIAFYRGEEQEKDAGIAEFKNVFENFNSIINWRFFLDLLAKVFAFIPYVIPPIALVSQVFSGELEVGKVSEAIGAFILVFTALGFIVEQFQALTGFNAVIERLHSFSQALNEKKEFDNVEKSGFDKIEFLKGENQLAVQSLTLLTPDYSRTLVRELSLQLDSEKGLLIVGPSGYGKSSLLRVIAGLWNSGKGKIVRPPLKDMLFLPQKPYLTSGSLRRQLLYPNINLNVSDEDLETVLRQVNLADLINQVGTLESEKVWSNVLSIGEQQRLAFARILVTCPKYAILDEATSALDMKNEERLYSKLQNLNMTYISIGHRTALEKYHDLVLEFRDDAQWQLRELV